MATAVDATDRLTGTDGFLVESPAGELGRVEEVRLGERDEPRGLAVQTTDGRHALLLDEDVVDVDREHGWVVVPATDVLHELPEPRDTEEEERPLWQTVVLLYASLVLLVAVAIAVSFVVARLVTGSAY